MEWLGYITRGHSEGNIWVYSRMSVHVSVIRREWIIMSGDIMSMKYIY